jgi:hypothetical protein
MILANVEVDPSVFSAFQVMPGVVTRLPVSVSLHVCLHDHFALHILALHDVA